MSINSCILAIVAVIAVFTTVNGFRSTTPMKASVRGISMFDLDKAVDTLSSNKILTKTAQLGLLTRLEKAGFTLTTAVPLLKLADEKDLLGVLEASSDKVLPLVAKGIELSPKLLPLAGVAIETPPVVLFAGAGGSLAAAAALIATVPDDTVSNVAFQVATGIPLGVILPGALAVGGVVLGKLSK